MAEDPVVHLPRAPDNAADHLLPPMEGHQPLFKVGMWAFSVGSAGIYTDQSRRNLPHTIACCLCSTCGLSLMTISVFHQNINNIVRFHRFAIIAAFVLVYLSVVTRLLDPLFKQ